jgi:hypothetical protein
MEMSSLTYIPDFSVKFFFQPIYTDYANKAYFDGVLKKKKKERVTSSSASILNMLNDLPIHVV